MNSFIISLDDIYIYNGSVEIFMIYRSELWKK